jgi:hypothetical protein
MTLPLLCDIADAALTQALQRKLDQNVMSIASGLAMMHLLDFNTASDSILF